MLSALLSERTAADELLRGEIGRKTADWGHLGEIGRESVTSPFPSRCCRTPCRVKRRPSAKNRRGSFSDRRTVAIAGQFVEAALRYADHPEALQLRAMNII